MTRAVFEAGAGRLKVVGRAGVGIDNVDLQAATEVSLSATLHSQTNALQKVSIRLAMELGVLRAA